ncbi:MAG: CapA family protein [Oscillospiraceae bacterium]|nr:CapA family protein [Oscillospiraceae bacterium]
MADSERRANRRTVPASGGAAKQGFFRRKRNSLLILLLAVVIVIGAAFLLRLLEQHSNAAETAAEPVTYETATLTAVGDISIDDGVLASAQQADGSYDFTNAFLNVAGLLSASDLTVGNLELTFSGEPYGGNGCSAPPSLADTLKTLGFDILQTANSKSLDGGMSGLAATLSTVRNSGIEPLGTYATQAERSASGGVLLKEVGGIRIAFLAFTKGFDGMSIPTGSDYCADVLYQDYDTQYSKVNTTAIQNAITAAKALSPDVIVAMVHWGSEYKMAVSESQTAITKLMFENGVDVILGSHSHMVGPMELQSVTRTDGTVKEVLLCNSLGNFLSSASRDYAQESVVLNLAFSKNSTTGETEISHVEYVPVYLAGTADSTSGRFEILDVYQSIALYDSAYLGRVSDAVHDKLLQTISDLQEHTGTDWDRGPLS